MSAAHTRALFGSDLELLLAFLSLIPPTQEPSVNRFARRRPCAIDRPGMHFFKLAEDKQFMIAVERPPTLAGDPRAARAVAAWRLSPIGG